MAKQVSKTVIGGFVISAIALLVIGIVIFGGGKFFTKTIKYVLFFDRSVKGLNVGAPVVFRGVEIGSVDSVVIRADTDKLTVDIPVVIEIEPDRFQTTGEIKLPKNPYDRAKVLIEGGLRAQLTLESMVTGQLMIEMDFFPDTPVRLTGIDAGYPELPTMPTSFEQLTQKLKKIPIEEIFEKLLSAINNIEKVLSAPELMDTVRNVKETTQNANQLIQSADKMIKDADTLVLNIARQVDPLSKNLRGAVGDVRKLLKNADGQIQPVSAKLQDALVSARKALDGAKATLATIDTFAAERSAFRIKLDASLEEIAAASRSVRALTEYLERHPEALLQGKSGS
jgi:paraquat-inducible protein B